MRILGLILFIIVLLTSCKEEKTESFDLETLPNDWVLLTEKNGKLVIYNSCDSGNLLLKITKNREQFELLLHGQQEDYDFLILESSQRNDTIFIDAKWKDSNEKQQFKFIWIDKQKGLGRWITTYSHGSTSNHIFVTDEKQTDFERIDQPCRECWGDECDEVEENFEPTDKLIEAIEKIFDNYVEHQESTDSQENKDLMSNYLESLDRVTGQKELEILINVWMYYDPTDFPSRNLVYKALENSRPESISAVKRRITNKKEWEVNDTAPYSELKDLLKQLGE